jgi:hypothetical protein
MQRASQGKVLMQDACQKKARTRPEEGAAP